MGMACLPEQGSSFQVPLGTLGAAGAASSGLSCSAPCTRPARQTTLRIPSIQNTLFTARFTPAPCGRPAHEQMLPIYSGAPLDTLGAAGGRFTGDVVQRPAHGLRTACMPRPGFGLYPHRRSSSAHCGRPACQTRLCIMLTETQPYQAPCRRPEGTLGFATCLTKLSSMRHAMLTVSLSRAHSRHVGGSFGPALWLKAHKSLPVNTPCKHAPDCSISSIAWCQSPVFWGHFRLRG